MRDLNIGPLGPKVTYQIADTTGAIVGQLHARQPIVWPTASIPATAASCRWRTASTATTTRSRCNSASASRTASRRTLSWTWAHEIDYKQGTYQDNDGFSTHRQLRQSLQRRLQGRQGQRPARPAPSGDASTSSSSRGLRIADGAFYRYAVNNWQLSGIVTLAAGRPTTAGVTVSDSTPFAGAAFTGTLNGFGGSNRPPFWEPAAIYTPPVYRLDARITKMLPFTERVKLALNFEAFNVTNSQVDTSLNFTAYTLRSGILSPTPGFGAGRASAGFPDGTNARRAQVSARFVF